MLNWDTASSWKWRIKHAVLMTEQKSLAERIILDFGNAMSHYKVICLLDAETFKAVNIRRRVCREQEAVG